MAYELVPRADRGFATVGFCGQNGPAIDTPDTERPKDVYNVSTRGSHRAGRAKSGGSAERQSCSAARGHNCRASGRTREAVSTSGQQRGREPGLPFSPRGPARGRGSTMASAEFSDERRLSNPDLSDDRRKSSVRRLSVNEPGKKNVKRGFQAGLTTEMEDEHVRSRRPVA